LLLILLFLPCFLPQKLLHSLWEVGVDAVLKEIVGFCAFNSAIWQMRACFFLNYSVVVMQTDALYYVVNVYVLLFLSVIITQQKYLQCFRQLLETTQQRICWRNEQLSDHFVKVFDVFSGFVVVVSGVKKLHQFDKAEVEVK